MKENKTSIKDLANRILNQIKQTTTCNLNRLEPTAFQYAQWGMTEQQRNQVIQYLLENGQISEHIEYQNGNDIGKYYSINQL